MAFLPGPLTVRSSPESRRFPGYRQQLHLRNKQAAEAQVIALPAPEVEVLERAVELSTASAEEAATPARWELVVGLSALVALICSVDRAAMSVALGPMGALLHTIYWCYRFKCANTCCCWGKIHAAHVRQERSLQTPVLAGEHFQWSDTVKGQVSSSFFLGYTVTNFVGASPPAVDNVAVTGACKRLLAFAAYQMPSVYTYFCIL